MSEPSRRLMKAAEHLLSRRFSPEKTRTILERTRTGYRQAAAGLPWERTFGARAVLKWAAFDVALHRALIEQGDTEEQAVALAADANWAVMRKGMGPLERIVGFFVRDPFRATLALARLTRRSVYRAPGWVMEDVAAEQGMGFDVRRCPLSDYLRPLDLGKLCERAFCDLDVRQAAMRGVGFRRTGTLAGGAERCDFRFSPRAEGGTQR